MLEIVPSGPTTGDDLIDLFVVYFHFVRIRTVDLAGGDSERTPCLTRAQRGRAFENTRATKQLSR